MAREKTQRWPALSRSIAAAASAAVQPRSSRACSRSARRPRPTHTEPLSTTSARSSPTSRAAARAASTVPDMCPDSGSTIAVSWVSSASRSTAAIAATDGWAVVGRRSERSSRS